MGIIAWIILGLIAGFIASKLVNKTGEGITGDIILGIIGAVLGGGIAHLMGINGVTGFNIYSMLIATGGAVVALVLYHALTRRRSLRFRKSPRKLQVGRNYEPVTVHRVDAGRREFAAPFFRSR
jgi:uncharacterized membrane protein YeaQ/YmgE (transglycosylase-associated protein family)